MISLKAIFFGSVLGAAMVLPAQAIPMLQLDASPGTYNTADESVHATANPFTLYALGDSSSSKFSISSYYYVSVAVINQSGAPLNFGDTGFGSFSIGSSTFTSSPGGGLVYGTPPIENAALSQVRDPGDLANHGIYPTYFSEIKFKFSTSKTSASYNTADRPGGPSGSGSLLYQDFTVNTAGLNSGYLLHFDLYNELLKAGDIDIDNFAPFSHDAVSASPIAQTPVTDASSSVTLLGLALLGLASLRLRFSSK